jgi:hypothetical protein
VPRGTQAEPVFWRLALEVLGQVHHAAPRSHLAPLFGSGLVLAALGVGACDRVGRSRGAMALGALAGAALAVSFTLTLFRGGSGHPAGFAGLRACVVTEPTVLSGDGIANLALFAPAAFLAVLAIGSPGRVAVAIAVVAVTVEGLQAIMSVGVCDSSDALLNAAGGLVAACAAAVVRSAVTRRSRPASDAVPGSDPCRRSC